MNIEALSDFLESCPEDYCSCISHQECEAWCVDGDTVYWKDSDGVYSGWMFEGIHKSSDHCIANIDTQQRVTTTVIFNRSSKVSYEDFEEKYWEGM